MLSDNPNVSLKIVDCSMFTKRILVAEPNHLYLQWNLEREPALYNHMEALAGTFIFPSQNQFKQEKIFINAPIRRNLISCFGIFSRKPFQLSTISFGELRIFQGGRAIVSLDTTSPCRPLVITKKAMQFNEDFSALPMKYFQNHYILFFTWLPYRMQLNSCIIQNSVEKI